MESSQLWYDNLRNKLKTIGFTENAKDPCVFNKCFRPSVQLTIAIYVDDLLCTCKHEEGLNWFAQALRDEYTDIQVNEGHLHSYLGQTFDFSLPGKVKITMEGYIQDLLTLYEVDHYSATPALSNLFVVAPESPRLSPPQSDDFHSRVAKLLYLAKRVRPACKSVQRSLNIQHAQQNVKFEVPGSSPARSGFFASHGYTGS